MEIDIIKFLSEGPKIGSNCFRSTFGFYPMKQLKMLAESNIIEKFKTKNLVSWRIKANAEIRTSVESPPVETLVLKVEDVKIEEEDDTIPNKIEPIKPDIVELEKEKTFQTIVSLSDELKTLEKPKIEPVSYSVPENKEVLVTDTFVKLSEEEYKKLGFFEKRRYNDELKKHES
jgi:hypothetical protein